MGSGGKDKTNRMLAEQTNRANAYQQQMANNAQQEYGYRTGLRDQLTNQYWDLSQGAPTTGGGSAGYTDPYQNLRQDIYDKYANWAETGGFTPEEMAGYRSWTTAPISGFYKGIQDQMARANNATGGYAGFNSQNAALTRQAAQQGANTALQSESSLQDQIRQGKLAGLSGMASEAERLNAGVHRGSPGYAGAPGTQDYYLSKLQGLMGGAEDLPYAQLAGQGIQLGTGTITNRVDETPAWQKAITGIIPSAVGAGIGALTGSFRAPSPSVDTSNWPNQMRF